MKRIIKEDEKIIITIYNLGMMRTRKIVNERVNENAEEREEEKKRWMNDIFKIEVIGLKREE